MHTPFTFLMFSNSILIVTLKILKFSKLLLFWVTPEYNEKEARMQKQIWIKLFFPTKRFQLHIQFSSEDCQAIKK